MATAAGRTAFQSTSGRLVVGVLSTTDPDRHERAIAALRAAAGYARPLTYSSTDRLKVPFALGVIDYLAETADITFTYSGKYRQQSSPTPGQYPNLDQLTAFLTGCAYGHHAGTDHPVKQTLIAALRERTSLLA